MSEDGASIGVTPRRALDTILGGKPTPSEDEQRTPEVVRAELEAKDDSVDGYDAHALVMAKYLLRLYEKYPQVTALPTEAVYRKDDEDKMIWEGPALFEGLSEVAKREYSDESHPFRQALSEATGFTWGWAVNSARYAAGLHEVPNPAIVTIG